MTYEVKYAMKHSDPCPYCQQALHVENGVFECGGEGEGICSIWCAIYAFGRAVDRLPKSATIDVDLWIDEWLADFIGPESWTEVGWDRDVHLRGVRETCQDEGRAMIHIRKRPDAPSSEPCHCGEAGSSITHAWGYYGPEGNGWVEVCKPCVVAAPNSDPGTRKLAQSELEAKTSC